VSTARPVALEAFPPPPGQGFELPPEEAHHLARVLRVKQGDVLRLFHHGQQWSGQVLEVRGGQVVATTIAELPVPPPLALDLWWALPPLKGGHTEELLRHLTEAGAAGFALMETRRAVAHHDPRKRDRFVKVLVEAAKQSGRASIPRLTMPTRPGPQPLSHLFSPQDTHPELPRFAGAFLAAEHQASAPPLSQAVRQILEAHAENGGRPAILVATGPEGGWAPEELDQAVQAHWKLVTLGALILRAETAPLVACGAALAALGAA
jgi:16S rRNA (uracil1498-N3)-methyltransferase